MLRCPKTKGKTQKLPLRYHFVIYHQIPIEILYYIYFLFFTKYKVLFVLFAQMKNLYILKMRKNDHLLTWNLNFTFKVA